MPANSSSTYLQMAMRIVLAVAIAAAVLSYMFAWAQDDRGLAAEISVSRHLQSGGFVPVAEEYADYEITMKNNGSVAIDNQSLWVHFFSANGKSNSQGTFAIASLAPGETRQFHIGPFKMRETGEHCLFVGVNREGEVGAPNQVALNYNPARCADSFIVYTPMLVIFLPTGIGIAAAGAIFIVWRFKRERP